MSEKYKFLNPDGIYFITTTVTKWVDIFTKPAYGEVILNSLKYCQNNKGLVIHAWCIMSNHLHLIISKSGETLLSDIMRDIKRFTSIEIIKTIIEINDSRKEWMLEIFKKTAERIKRVEKYKVWQDGNHPIELDTNQIIDQKLEYIHHNPVKAGYIWEPEEYTYSSAIDYADGKGLLKIELID